MEKYFDFIFEHENLFIIVDNNDKTWFAANNVARILEYKAPQKVIEKFVPIKYKKQYQDIDVNSKNYNKKYQNKTMFIGNLVALQELYLGNNHLTTIPQEIGNLVALQKLSLSDNRIITIPEEIRNKPNLKIYE